ncbi:hypothetical protein K523DRAFT_421219 [Schizophyllum commune Tattone D]|nr:hypothetical protein K523DRAFT_421219 [Schizophyllum commune Tattone D]
MTDILNPTALLQTVELSRQISSCIHRFDMSCNHIIRPLEDLRQQKLISQARESIVVLSDFSTVVGDLLSCHYEALDNLQQFFDQDHDSAMATSVRHSNYEVTMRSLSRVVTTSSSVLRSLSALERHVVRDLSYPPVVHFIIRLLGLDWNLRGLALRDVPSAIRETCADVESIVALAVRMKGWAGDLYRRISTPALAEVGNLSPERRAQLALLVKQLAWEFYSLRRSTRETADYIRHLTVWWAAGATAQTKATRFMLHAPGEPTPDALAANTGAHQQSLSSTINHASQHGVSNLFGGSMPMGTIHDARAEVKKGLDLVLKVFDTDSPTGSHPIRTLAEKTKKPLQHLLNVELTFDKLLLSLHPQRALTSGWSPNTAINNLLISSRGQIINAAAIFDKLPQTVCIPDDLVSAMTHRIRTYLPQIKLVASALSTLTTGFGQLSHEVGGPATSALIGLTMLLDEVKILAEHEISNPASAHNILKAATKAIQALSDAVIWHLKLYESLRASLQKVISARRLNKRLNQAERAEITFEIDQFNQRVLHSTPSVNLQEEYTKFLHACQRLTHVGGDVRRTGITNRPEMPAIGPSLA